MQEKLKILIFTLFLFSTGFYSNLFGKERNPNSSTKSLNEVGINIYEHSQDVCMINMYMAFLLIAGCLLGYKYKDKYFNE